MNSENRFIAAPFIREVGRGKKGARDMSRDDARTVYTAMLDGRLSDLELGAFLIGMRIKGESVSEIAGFLEAAEASFTPIFNVQDGFLTTHTGSLPRPRALVGASLGGLARRRVRPAGAADARAVRASSGPGDGSRRRAGAPAAPQRPDP